MGVNVHGECVCMCMVNVWRVFITCMHVVYVFIFVCVCIWCMYICVCVYVCGVCMYTSVYSCEFMYLVVCYSDYGLVRMIRNR